MTTETVIAQATTTGIPGPTGTETIPTTPASSLTGNPSAPPSPTADNMTDHQKFRESLPEAYRTDPVFKNFNSMDDLVKSYANNAKLVGADKNTVLKIPNEPTPEAMGEIYNKLGRPEKADGYKLEALKDLPGMGDEAQSKIREIAYNNGISAKALDELTGWFKGDVEQATKAQNDQTVATMADLKAKAQTQFGDAYDNKLALAKTLAQKVGGDEFTKLIEQNPTVFENPAMLKVLSTGAEAMQKLAVQTREDNGFLPGTGATATAMTPAEAKSAIVELQNSENYRKVVFDPTNPQRQYMIDKMTQLNKYAYPETKK